MGLKPDHWIRKMALEHRMIEPFVDAQVRDGVISYGVSSYGYDIRVADEFMIFTNVHSAIVDPKHFDPKSMFEFKGEVCIIPPNSFALARTVEYFRIPRKVLTVCLGKSTYARCFRGDTRAALVDGTAPTLEEMARRAESGEMFWGYSIGENGRLIVTLLDAPRYIGRDSLVEVALDNDEKIYCTPDHAFMLRDGRWQAAGELQPGASLMPLYRSIQRGYEMVYQPLNGRLYPTHRLADEWNIRNDLYADQPGTHRHHLDFDRLNNNPWNIARMEASAHIRLHNAESYGEEFDPGEHSLAIRASLQRRAQDPEWVAAYSQAQSERAVNFWHEEIYAETRERLLEQRRNPSEQTRQAHRDAMLRRFEDVAERLRHVVRAALDQAGSIRGAARLLNCDRAVFRRFPEVMDEFRGRANNHKVLSVRPLAGDHDVYCLTVPEAGNFALESGVFVHNCGIIVNVTPFEPEWEGFVTLEISNTTPLPAKIYANEGLAQVLFFEADEECEVSYADKKGKYQRQKSIVLPKV
ncbi:MAG: dCTP deaminase [Chloroflexota bacterium]